MEQSNWDDRLDTGTGDGTIERTGRCTVCADFVGDATETVKHAGVTGHRVTYNGTLQDTSGVGVALNDFDITEVMIGFGGSFVAQLGRLFRQADVVNQSRIKLAFPDYWQKYRSLAESLRAAQR